MIYLLLSILLTSSLFVIFKYFEIFKINTLQAIVVNYFVAFILGIYFANAFGKLSNVYLEPWWYGTLVLGFLFVTVFLILGIAIQKNGLSVASLVGKMSVVIPILVGFIYYKEQVTFMKVIGILLALLAVYLATQKNAVKLKKKESILFLVLLFLGAGINDTLIKYIETNYVSENQVSFFSGILFGVSGVFGVIILLAKNMLNNEKFEAKSILAGLVLGVPNYFCIYFMVKALQYKGMDSSTIFTINNVGVVVLSTLLGVWMFREKLNKKNKLGVLLAITSIILVTLA